MPTSSILVADDILSSSRQGHRRSENLRSLASELEKLLHTHVHFLYVEDIPSHLRKKDKLPPLYVRNPKMVSKLQDSLDSLCPDCEVHLDTGSPVSKILDWSKKVEPDIIVTGTRGQKGLSKFFLGSVAEEVIRHSTVPVIVVGPHYEAHPLPASTKTGMRILLLTDLSSASSRAESYARKLAKKMNARVSVMHSVGEPIMRLKHVYYQSRIPAYSLDTQIKEMKQFARLELSKVMEKFKADGIQAQGKLETQERGIEKDIQEELAKGYDLIIMGTHSRNRMLATFLGSVARKTCLLSTVPVLVVRSDS